MANYPRFTLNISDDIQRFKETMIAWANELTRELDTNDLKVAARPSTNIYTVVTTSDIGRAEQGDIAYSISASTFRGYTTTATGWVDFH